MLSVVVRYGLLIGAAVVVVDWVLSSIGASLAPDDPVAAAVGVVDLALNVLLFGFAGYLGYRQTEGVRGGAEVGVIAGVLAGVVAAGRLLLVPPAEAPPANASGLVGVLALNVVLGGVSAILGAWLARRSE